MTNLELEYVPHTVDANEYQVPREVVVLVQELNQDV